MPTSKVVPCASTKPKTALVVSEAAEVVVAAVVATSVAAAAAVVAEAVAVAAVTVTVVIAEVADTATVTVVIVETAVVIAGSDTSLPSCSARARLFLLALEFRPLDDSDPFGPVFVGANHGLKAIRMNF